MKARTCLTLIWLALVISGCQRAPERTLELSHFVVEVDTPDDLDMTEEAAFDRGGSRRAVDPVTGILVLNAIINLGEKAWNVVRDNKAVTNVKSLYANALPKGAVDGRDLDGFSDLQQKSFRAYGKNPFGATVYDVHYTVLHRYGGNVGGKGHYLDQVTVIPTYVKALWGYGVDVSVTASPPTNVGTSEDPVGDLLLEVSLRVSTLVKSADTRRVWELRGDSAAPKELLDSSPTPAKLVASAP